MSFAIPATRVMSRSVTGPANGAAVHKDLIETAAMVPILLVTRPGVQRPPPSPVPVCWTPKVEDGIGVTNANAATRTHRHRRSNAPWGEVGAPASTGHFPAEPDSSPRRRKERTI
jgi:hypothetical protein